MDKAKPFSCLTGGYAYTMCTYRRVGRAYFIFDTTLEYATIMELPSDKMEKLRKQSCAEIIV